MKKIILPFFLIFFVSVSSAQFPAALDKNYAANKSAVAIASDYFFESNAVTNVFVRAYLKNSYLDSSLKESVSDKLKANNKLGAGWNTGITYLKRNSEKKSGWLLSFSNRLYAKAHFSKDLFELLFYGNAKYKGKNAVMNDFSASLFKYQQIGMGIFKEKEKISWGVTGYILKGQEHLSITADKAELFTAEDGEYLDINTSIEIRESDSTNKKLTSVNGIGAAADFYFSYSDGNKWKINFEIKDLGLISWNSKSVTTKADTFFHFEGVEVDNIFKLEDSTLVTKSDTSYFEKFIDSKTAGAYSTFLPLLVHLQFMKELKENKSYLHAGVYCRYSQGFLPQFYLSALFYAGEKFFIAPGFLYGGFATIGFSLQLGKDFGKGFVLTAGSRHLEGFLIPKSTTSQGAEVSFRKFF